MNITEFIAIAVVGVALSVVVQIIKGKYGTDSNATKLITVALAVLVGGAYVWLRSTPWFETTVMVLTSASAVYALVLKK